MLAANTPVAPNDNTAGSGIDRYLERQLFPSDSEASFVDGKKVQWETNSISAAVASAPREHHRRKSPQPSQRKQRAW